MEKVSCQTFGCRNSPERVGVLIAQLGTPEAPTPKALRPYLRQFLSDPRVIEANRVVWWFILNFLVLPFRAKRSARLYARIWRKDGSPLMYFTRSITEKLNQKFAAEHPHVVVKFGMRYGQPSLERGLDALIAEGCNRILVVPMYPQYSATTTASIYDAVFPHLLKRRVVPTLRVLEPYYRHPKYIDALVRTIEDSYSRISPRPEKLVLSYHGVPARYIENGDTYCCQCVETTASLHSKFHIPRADVIHTFQSRFGREPWLTPYTDVTIEELAKNGAKHVAVACPGFTADCLETLDEIGNEGSHLFTKHGGEALSLIPCLNDQPVWVESFFSIIHEALGRWAAIGNDCKGNETISCLAKIGNHKSPSTTETQNQGIL